MKVAISFSIQPHNRMEINFVHRASRVSTSVHISIKNESYLNTYYLLGSLLYLCTKNKYHGSTTCGHTNNSKRASI